MEGWIKLHRKLLQWEWHDNINVFTLFIHCVLLANHQEKKWQGVIIQKGSFISSYPHLAKITGLTVQQMRTSLNKLKSTGELTVKTTNKYSVLIIHNWNQYQIDNTQVNSQVTVNQQSNNSQITATKNDNNDKNDKNDKNIILSKDNTETVKTIIMKKEYGNSDINYLIGYLKSKLGLPLLDGSAQLNRRYCWLALNKFGGRDKIILLIDACANDKFWSTKVTSFQKLYYNAVAIISSPRGGVKYADTNQKANV